MTCEYTDGKWKNIFSRVKILLNAIRKRRD